MRTPPLTPATFHILLALVEGAQHGFAIKRAVEARTNGAVTLGPGTLYAALARLADSGLVSKKDPAHGDPATPGPPSPIYSLTGAGRAAVDAELERLEHDVDSAHAVLRQEES